MSLLKLSTLVLLTATVFLSFNTGAPPYKTGMGIGEAIPDISTNTIDGKPFDLKDLKGKMVIVNVWASYDAPSRVKNNELEAVRSRFSGSGFVNGKGLEVVSISLDRFMTPVNEAVKMDNIQDFYHICDLQGKNGLVKKLGITGPVAILVDGDGRIVTKSNSLDKITDALSFLVRN